MLSTPSDYRPAETRGEVLKIIARDFIIFNFLLTITKHRTAHMLFTVETKTKSFQRSFRSAITLISQNLSSLNILGEYILHVLRQ